MSQVINTNISSLTAQRNLNSTQSALQTSIQRLSSGLRINSARDDSAGLAISERFSTQIRGLNQAVRNANDGISLAQTGEGALAEITTNLQRIRELAVQSVNATNSESDRAALDLEVQQRLAEIDRISSQTNFNGRNILDGSFGSAAFQVGANVGETITLGLSSSTRTADLGAVATATSVDLDNLIAEGTDAVTGSAAAYTFDTSNILGDYSTVAAVAGTSTVAVSAGAVDGDSFTLTDGTNTTTFSFSGSSGATPAVNVTDADTVSIVFDSDTPLTAATTGDQIQQAIEAYKLAGNGDTRFDDITATDDDSGLVTLTYGTGGLPSTLGYDFAITGGGTLAGTVTQDASGSDADTSANRTFSITDPEGNALSVTLDSNITNATEFLAEITSAAGYGAATFTAAVTDTTNITITDGSNAAGNFSIGGTNASLVTDELVTDGDVAGVADVAQVAASEIVVGTDSLQFTIGDGSAASVAAATYSTIDSFVAAINTALGSNATASLSSENVLTITSGENVVVTQTSGLTDSATTPSEVNPFTTTSIGASASESGDAITVSASGDLDDVDVLTVAGANAAIQRVDSALTSVSTLRSTFGAIQNRFESTITNLSTTVENLSASRSRIRDADFAAETAALTQAQILQQAGIAALSQANAQPQNVLALLQ